MKKSIASVTKTNMRSKLLIFLNLVLVLSYNCISQVKTDQQIFAETEYTLGTTGSVIPYLTEAKRQSKILLEHAIAEKNSLNIAHAYDLLIRITDRRTEDSLYFKNSAVLDSLIQNSDNTELRGYAHFLLAKRIMQFLRSYKWDYKHNLFKRNDIPVNYATFSDADLIEIAADHFSKARKIFITEKEPAIESAIWLSSDPLMFLFKPQLYDICIAEQLKIADNSPYPSLKDSTLLSVSPTAFMSVLDSFSVNKKMALYAEWIRHHKINNPDAAYFIESLARKDLYNLYQTRDEYIYEATYEKYLQLVLAGKNRSAKAYTAYQLFFLWKIKAARYNMPLTGYNFRNNFPVKFDRTVKDYYVKALSLLQTYQPLLDSFQYLNTSMLEAKSFIEEPKSFLTIQSNYVPGKPLLTRLSYKNTQHVFVRIVRVNLEMNFPAKVDYDELLHMPVVREQTVSIDTSDQDYQLHSALLKIDALSSGRYFILVSDSNFDEDRTFNYYPVIVSDMSMVYNGQKAFVLNRITGLPIANTKAVVNYSLYDTTTKKYYIFKTVIEEVKKDGSFTISKSDVRNIILVNGTDSLLEYYNNSGSSYYSNNDDFYDKDDYDNKVEFYKEKLKLNLFTDRSIYRPGQKVYFKGILTTIDAGTGKRVVLNEKNLQSSLLKRLFSNSVKKMVHMPFKFTLEDPFSRELDSIDLRVNEFGSVAGSFIIPADGATGEWQIDVDTDDEDIDFDYNTEARFRVEEYKRPSFEIKIQSPKKILLPSDSFSFLVKVKSFAGAMLDKVEIEYTLTASIRSVNTKGNSNRLPFIYRDSVITDATAYTDLSGTLAIPVTNPFKANLKEIENIDYALEATVIDASGESYDKTLTQHVTSTPVRISITANKISDRNNMPAIDIRTSVENVGTIDKKIRLKVFRIVEDSLQKVKQPFQQTDRMLYTLNELSGWFPDLDFNNTEFKPEKLLVFDTLIPSNGRRQFQLPAATFPVGNYEIQSLCIEDEKIIGENYSTRFSLYDYKTNEIGEDDFYQLTNNSAKPGEKLQLTSGHSQDLYCIYQLTYGKSTKNGVMQVDQFSSGIEKSGVHQTEFTVPRNAVHQLLITKTYVFNNRVYTENKSVYINFVQEAEPEILIEQFRNVLLPGGKETFSVAVKTKNENKVAELLTAMYDASLDRIEEHGWEVPRNRYEQFYARAEWTSQINSLIGGDDYNSYNFSRQHKAVRKTSGLVWWLDAMLLQKTSSVIGSEDANRYQVSTALAGRVAGISISSSSLDAVVVTGYGISRRSNLTGSVSTLQLRGESSIAMYSKMLVILDGVVYTDDISKINSNTITAAVVLKDAEATAMYGAQAANGVLILSTKGDIKLPIPPEPPVQVRRNFEETAFFFPQVHADKNGYFTFSFTLPESVTEWKWMMLAHTKDGLFTYREKKLVSQLPLMLQPNMPRLLYQGDQLFLKARISNLDSIEAKGKVNCYIEDVVTGKDITAICAKSNDNNFSVNAHSNSNSVFEINVPESQINPIKIKMTAVSGNFSDGEEHILPVLSKKIFIRKSIPVAFAKQDSNIVTPSLPADATAFGLGLYITPKPQAALVNSLPFLANYSFNCAEQTFNKMLAHAVAIKLMRSDTALQRSWNAFNKIPVDDKSNATLPDQLSDETMPWLNLNSNTVKQQKQLMNLLDSFNSKEKMVGYFKDLTALQNTDGGMTWFKGGDSDPYISKYILSSFGQLKANLLLDFSKIDTNSLQTLIKKLITYCDNSFLSASQHYSDENYLYARSYWSTTFPLSMTKDKVDSTMNALWKSVQQQSLLNQTKLIFATLKLYKEENVFYKNAIKQLRFIEDDAINDAVNGVRWKNMADKDDPSTSDEETVGLLLQAFKTAGLANTLETGVIQWLLTSKANHQYNSTKAVAAIVNCLINQQQLPGAPQTLSATIGNQQLQVTNDLLSAKLSDFTNSKIFPEQVIVKNNGENKAVHGSIDYFYFSEAMPSDLQNQVVIDKKLFVFRNNSWIVINADTKLEAGEKVKADLNITSTKELKYVLITDSRAACLEPADGSSGYEYGERIHYYQSPGDAGYHFFAETIGAGNSVISYEMVVSQSGTFTNGVASLQCMYQPEVTAYGHAAAELKVMR